MAGKSGKGKATRSGPRSSKKPVSGQERAGTIFAPARCTRLMRQGRYSERIGSGAGAFMAGVLDYLTSELCELSVNIAQQHKAQRIKPRHIQLAIRADEEINKMFANILISDGGVMPNINEYLFPKKGKKNAEATQEM
jgi:histone H2A